MVIDLTPQPFQLSAEYGRRVLYPIISNNQLLANRRVCRSQTVTGYGYPRLRDRKDTL